MFNLSVQTEFQTDKKIWNIVFTFKPVDKMFSHDLSNKTSSVTLENGVVDKILEN